MLNSIDMIVEWVQQNGWIVLGSQYVYSCFVQSLPDPDVRSPKWYLFVFRFSHTLAGNTNVVRKQLKGGL